ncbi:hypothetical protein GCM10027414_37000 [Humibacter ginsengiterrae]
MLRPPEGAFAGVPVCRPSEWVHAVELALHQPAIERLMRSRRRGRAQLLAVAGRLAAAADFSTGRNVAVSFQTVADALHCSPGTVKKCVQFLSHLGFHIEVCHGRDLLTLAELAEARVLGAEDQRAVASTRYLVIPSWARQLVRAARAVVSSAPLHVLDQVNDEETVVKSSPTRAKARSTAAARPRLRTRRRNQVPQDRSPRSFELQRLAALLASRMPWLARDRHIGVLCDALTRAGIDPSRWSAAALIDTVTRHNVEGHVTVVHPTEQRDPIGYLVWMLRSAIEPSAETPIEAADRRRAQLRDEATKHREEAAELRARMAQDDPAEVAAIIQAMRAEAQRASDRMRRTRRDRDQGGRNVS